MNLTAWLLSMVGPVVARVLAAFGLSLVSVTGLVAATTALRSLVLDSLGALPLAAAQLLGLFGVWEALGMAFGALSFVISWRLIGSSWRLARQ